MQTRRPMVGGIFGVNGRISTHHSPPGDSGGESGTVVSKGGVGATPPSSHTGSHCPSARPLRDGFYNAGEVPRERPRDGREGSCFPQTRGGGAYPAAPCLGRTWTQGGKLVPDPVEYGLGPRVGPDRTYEESRPPPGRTRGPGGGWRGRVSRVRERQGGPQGTR